MVRVAGVRFYKELMAVLGDYDKVGSQYKRSFLWTGPLYYSAVQYAFALLSRRRMEKAAGSFDAAENVNTRAAMVRVRV
jgi:phosphatidylglycerol phospholipase C